MNISFDQKKGPWRTSARSIKSVRSANGRKTRWLGVAIALREELECGRYVTGEPLPSTRTLAERFGVHRHTVLLACDALVAEGLVEARPRRGYYVCAPTPAVAKNTVTRSPAAFAGFRFVRAARKMDPRPTQPPVIALHAALPDVALLPIAELRAAYSHALNKHARSVLALSEPALPGLQRELLRYLRRARGLVPESLLITQGSQHAIALIAQVLLEPGDVVLMEEPGYEGATDVFRALGARVQPLPVDGQGLCVEALVAFLKRRRARLLYTTPTHQYPTTVTLTSPRRRALLAATLHHGLPVLEDDYDHEFHYRGEPQAPLAAMGAPNVIYVGTLSKLVAPGLRLGFACGARSVIDAMQTVQRMMSRGTDRLTQAAVMNWLSDGGLDRHLRRARRVYATRRNSALLALQSAAHTAQLHWNAPDGGLAIWTRWPEHDVVALAKRAAARGVWILPEPLTSVRRQGHGVRLAFGNVTSAQFEQGVRVIVEEAERMCVRT